MSIFGGIMPKPNFDSSEINKWAYRDWKYQQNFQQVQDKLHQLGNSTPTDSSNLADAIDLDDDSLSDLIEIVNDVVTNLF
ncbi:hypothetical protein NIES2119_31820 [[Phormidium ambiguum] IAM M-71]|uniref:Uncharacterized protein n=1 Tax=[Phormidium ambiguum] IAM M-71 TaxID=454136 RepID=A0A1U7I1K5_9CYAN|nr:hypothetical protein [Phormidium ambiguum]OKH29875.1 hypothetical protein NIES2119_31820 [Phormidium ambiguum IAM M-71]